MLTTKITRCGALSLHGARQTVRTGNLVASRFCFRSSRAESRQRHKFSSHSQTATQRSNAGASDQGTSSSEGQARGPFSAFVAWYESLLTQYPLVTKSLTGGFIAAGGDFFCQTVLEGPYDTDQKRSRLDSYDPARSFRFAFLGTFFVAPTNHIWYRFLAKRVAPGKTWTSASTRTALDQFVWTPVYTLIWLASLWKMEGTDNADISQALEREYLGVMKANWLLWIPAQLANFKLVPLKYQVLFTNVVELVWNAFLSYAATGKGDDKEVGNAHQNRQRHKTQQASTKK